MANPRDLNTAIDACIKNGQRLLDESYDLEFRLPPSSRFFLIMIAQEEFAKAFVLYLIQQTIVPFNRYVLRAINDHVCKQLLGIIMDYIIMHWENSEGLEAVIRRDIELGDWLPDDVASAMELLRHEKIGRWESHIGFGAMNQITILQLCELQKVRKTVTNKMRSTFGSGVMVECAARRRRSQRMRRSRN